jgi:hypothetical protein
MSPFFAGSIGGLGGAQVTEDQEDGRYAVGTKKTQRRRVPRRSEKAKTGAAEWVRSTFKMFTVKCFHASFVSKKWRVRWRFGLCQLQACCAFSCSRNVCELKGLGSCANDLHLTPCCPGGNGWWRSIETRNCQRGEGRAAVSGWLRLWKILAAHCRLGMLQNLWPPFWVGFLWGFLNWWYPKSPRVSILKCSKIV